MKKRTNVISIFAIFLSLSLMSCSHIDRDRAPSSLKTQIGQCKMVPDDTGKNYQVWVDEKPYPNAEYHASAEAEKLMLRFQHTGACNW